MAIPAEAPNMSQDTANLTTNPALEVDHLIADVRSSLVALPEEPSQRLDTEEIMRRIHLEVANRRSPAIAASAGDESPVAPFEAGGRDFDPWMGVVSTDVRKREFDLGELLEPGDLTFIETAYRALLRRDPEPEGYDFALSQLRSGQMSKIEILGSLRWSAEGRARSVHVDGLLVPYILQRWQRKKFIGPIIAWLQGMARLGSLAHRQQRLEVNASREAHRLGAALNTLGARWSTQVEEVEARARSSDSVMARLHTQLADAQAATAEMRIGTEERIATLESSVNSQITIVQRQIKGILTRQEEASEAFRALAILESNVASIQSRLRSLEPLEKSLTTTRDSVASLEKRHAGTVERIASIQAQLLTLEPVAKALEVTRDSVASLEKRHAGMVERSASIQTQLLALEPVAKSLEATRDSVDTLEKHHAAMADDVASLQIRVAPVPDAIAATQAAIKDLTRHHSATATGLRALAPVEGMVDKLSAVLASVTERISSMQSHLDTLAPFPAALTVAQQAIDNLGRNQAEVATALHSLVPLESRLKDERKQIDAELSRLAAALEQERNRSAEHDSRLATHEQELGAHWTYLDGHGAVLSLMDQEKARQAENVHALDAMYAAFEDVFRGDQKLVRTRAEPYLDFLAEAGVGTADAPVLDLGSGRGEWLELLRERGLHGRGIDNNRIFVETCRGRGLAVTEGDVIDIMEGLPEASIGAITGFHIAEHLPFPILVRLLDEARRLLVPGGLLALETPNPENLQVASHLFYMDPTHRNPIPPETLRWIVEARGFGQARIERWTLARDMAAPPLLDDQIPGAASVNVLLAQLAVAPDYAIIARRGVA